MSYDITNYDKGNAYQPIDLHVVYVPLICNKVKDLNRSMISILL